MKQLNCYMLIKSDGSFKNFGQHFQSNHGGLDEKYLINILQIILLPFKFTFQYYHISIQKYHYYFNYQIVQLINNWSEYIFLRPSSTQYLYWFLKLSLSERVEMRKLPFWYAFEYKRLRSIYIKVIIKYMNFLFIPFINQVPEWKECYYDYHTLNKIIKSIQKCVTLLQKIQSLIADQAYKVHSRKLENFRYKVLAIIQNECHYFSFYADKQANVIALFVQYKLYEVRQKLKKYTSMIKIIGKDNHQLLLLIENLYIESYYLAHTTQYNIGQQYKTIHEVNEKIHNLSYYLLPYTTDFKMKRMHFQSKKLLDQVEFLYYWYNKETHVTPDQYLRVQEIKLQKLKSLQPLELGLVMGALFAFLGVVILINVVNRLGLGKNQIFTDNFPVWRGAASIIWYIWVLGLCVLFYQQSGINYKLIFHFERHNLPHSRFLFMLASAFSFIYLALFTFFFLELSATIKSHFVYYGEVFWLVFIVYMLQPFPILQQRGRFYMIKMIFRAICSPCYPMNFLIIWIAQQSVSLTQPMTDLFYAIFFFCSRDATLTKYVTPNVNSAIVITIFSYRMFQNLKFWLQVVNSKPDKKYDFWLPPFLGFVRSLSGFTTAITAIFYRLKTFNGAFVLWMVVIIISTLVSWYVDVRGDWGLLQHQSRFVLREKILFPKARPFYYFLMIFNLALRTAWALTISSFVTNSTGVWPSLFTLILSFVQIVRRGIWNILRIENEHVKNCGEFQATIRDGNILKIVQKKVQEITAKRTPQTQDNQESLQRIQEEEQKVSLQTIRSQQQLEVEKLRKPTQLQIFKGKLAQRRQNKSKVDKKIRAYQHSMTKIMRQLRFMRFSSFFIVTDRLLQS